MNKLRYKKIVYDFDLVSGKVNQVSYQPGKPDAYYHRYSYDAENRITDVFTGRDSVQLFLFPEREAHYTYYKHGPLFRTDIGQLKVQGQDFAYTLHGWIKGVNPVLGGTLTNGTDTTEAYPTAQDAYGYSLNYFRGDYKAIGYSPQVTSILGALGMNAAPLYNGNISAMAVYTPKLGAAKVYNYHYDQLNRIVAMDVFNGLNPSAGTFVPINISDYRERVTYDPNGNIMTYNRHGDAARLSMDSMRYFYTAGSNKLHKVLDDATDVGQPQYANYNDLKQGQVDNNYEYDEIGNLTKDLSEGIQAGGISWTVYGKIASVTKNGSVIYYTYDASGNRISKKTATDETYYVRDASGNVLSVYTKPAAGSLSQSEIHLYGSSRLGMLTAKTSPDTENQLSGGFGTGKNIKFTRGEKIFELSNHLGNVLVTVSDRRQQVSAGGITVDSYLADVVSANDYYPFGMSMPGRRYEAQSGYRYGFNGKEKDRDISEGAIVFEARIIDTRIGRFFTKDPLGSKYPWQTPYAYHRNSPISSLDWLGMGDKFYGDDGKLLYESNGEGTNKYIITNDQLKELKEKYKNNNKLLKEELIKVAIKAYSSSDDAAKAWAQNAYTDTKNDPDHIERAAQIYYNQKSNLYILGNTVIGRKANEQERKKGVKQVADYKASTTSLNGKDINQYTFEVLTKVLKPGETYYTDIPGYGNPNEGSQEYKFTQKSVIEKCWVVIGSIHTHPPGDDYFSVGDRTGMLENGPYGGDISSVVDGLQTYLVSTSYSTPQISKLDPVDFPYEPYFREESEGKQYLRSKTKYVQ